MVMYRPLCTCRCVRMCIHAQELVYWENKDVLQTETREFTVNVHFSMMMNAGIAHFFSSEENEVPWFWYQCEMKNQTKEHLLSVPCATTFPVTPPSPSTLNFRFQNSILFASGFLSKPAHFILTEIKAFENCIFRVL